MKILAILAGALLGLMFVGFSLLYFFGPPPPAPPEGTLVAAFMKAMMPTGYMNFVKVFEILGGVLVAIPFTRNLGLLILGPIIINILAFHVFIAGVGTLQPFSIVVLTVICVLALFLLWCERRAFAGLVKR